MLNDSPIMWRSARQSTVATSTCEAEFVAASGAAKEVLWVRNFLDEIGIVLKQTPLFIDNLGTVKLIENDRVHVKTTSRHETVLYT